MTSYSLFKVRQMSENYTGRYPKTEKGFDILDQSKFKRK